MSANGRVSPKAMGRKKIAILTTHPIQYQAPWFRALASHPELDLQVFFCHKATPKEQAEAGFGVEFDWDINLLDGYPYRFLKNVARKPSLSNFTGLDTPEIVDVIERNGYDAVLVNGWHYKSAWQALRVCWRIGTPAMVRGDSHLKTKRHLLKRALKWYLYSAFIPKFDACLAVGKWSREYYLHYGARADRIFLVPHVLDEGWFANEIRRLQPQREELRKQWGFDGQGTVFLFVGKFIEKKRPMDFIGAVELARRRGNLVAGLMIGDGPLRPACEAMAATRRVPIAFAGFLNQSQLVRSYIAADVLVLPSDGRETWGLVVNEAMVCGLPALVSDKVGCGPDLAEPGITGDVFALGDVERIASLMGVWSDPDRRCVARERARERVKDCSIARAVDGTLEAMRAVCETIRRSEDLRCSPV